MIQRTALKRASVHGCFSGRNSCGIYLWWILWISIYRMRRSLFVRGAFCLRRELPEPGAQNFVLSSFALIALGWGSYFVFVLWKVESTGARRGVVLRPQ